MSFEIFCGACVALVFVAYLADIAHSIVCERRSKRRFDAIMNPHRLERRS